MRSSSWTGLKIYLKKPRVWLLSIIYALLLFQRTINTFNIDSGGLIGLYVFWSGIFEEFDLIILLVFISSLASVHLGLEERTHRFMLFRLNRESISSYVKHLLFQTIVTTSMVPMIGLTIFSLLILTRFSLTGDLDSPYLADAIGRLLNGHLLVQGRPLLFYFLIALNICFHHLFFILPSVLISIFIQDRYLIYIMPSIIFTAFSVGSIRSIFNPLIAFGMRPMFTLHYHERLSDSLIENLSYLFPTVYFLVIVVMIYGLLRLGLRRQLRRGVF